MATTTTTRTRKRRTTKTPPPIASTGKTDAEYAAEVAARTSRPAGRVRTGDPKADRAVRDAAAAKDAGVLAGLVPPADSPEAEQDKAARPEPKPRPARARKVKPEPEPEATPAKSNGKAPARKAGITELVENTKPTPASGTAATASNGAGAVNSARLSNQALARQLVNLAAERFGNEPVENQVKVANWLKSLPTGGEGAGWMRYWPESFARPTTADWRIPS